MKAIFTLLITAEIFAQQLTINGFVLDKEKNPIKDALIEIKQDNFQTSTITSSTGYFRTIARKGKAKILISHIAFNQKTTELNLKNDTTLYISLTPKVFNLPEITITVTKYPINSSEASNFVEIIPSTTIEKLHIQSFSDILKSATSIFIRDYGGTPAQLKTISLRGTGSENTAFLINGIRLPSFQNGVVDLSMIPIDAIERVEIVHSNMSSLYGMDALGGVINIVTKRNFQPKFAEVKISTGSYGYRKFIASAGMGKNSLNFFFNISRNYGRGDFKYKYKLGDKELTLWRRNSHFSITNGYLNIESGSSSLTAYYIRSFRGIPQATTKFDPTSSANQIDEDLNLNLSSTKIFKSAILKINFNFRNSYLRYRNNDIVISGVGIDDYYRNFLYGANLGALFDLKSDFLITSGAEFYLAKAKGNSFGNAERHGFSLFAGLEKKLTFLSETKIFPMIRYDRFSDFGGNLSYKFGLNAKITNGLNLKFSAGTGFRAPTFNDMYFPGSGDKNIKPERSNGYDAGIAVNLRQKINIEISYFNINITNKIVWLPSKENPNLWKPTNIDKVNSSGVEISGTITISRKITVAGNYSIIKSLRKNKRSENDQTYNKYLIYIPKETGNVRVDFSDEKFFTIVDLNYIGLRYTTETNDRWLEPYFVVNLSAGMNFKFFDVGFRLKFSVQNLLNESYETIIGYPMPLRSFLFEIGLKI